MSEPTPVISGAAALGSRVTLGATSRTDPASYFDLGGGEDADTTICHVIPGCTWTAVIPGDDEDATMGDIYALTHAHAETCPALHGSKDPTP